MAIDYTKLFTLIGKHVDKINDYYAYIATYTSDETAIESTFSSQSTVWLADGLKEMYDGFKSSISSDVSQLIDRISTILTDETLVGANFVFGQGTSLDLVLPALIEDMVANAQTVKNNAQTVGAPTYDVVHTNAFYVYRGSLLDGVTAPTANGVISPQYSGLTSQLAPTSETFKFTCTSDSEADGLAQGSEVFTITGTGAVSEGYDVTGENIGIIGTIVPVDNDNTGFLLNNSFDNWTAGEPDDWTTGAAGNYEETGAMYGTGSALRTIQDDTPFSITQTMSKDLFKRNKTYLLTAWVGKDTDVAGDEQIDFGITINGVQSTVSITPTSTTFEAVSLAFLIPAELTDDVEIEIATLADILDSTNDAVIIDNVCISEMKYYNGVAFAITCGSGKVLKGDSATIAVSNNDAGKFQTFFRKAYKAQLPSSGTPSISDSLVA